MILIDVNVLVYAHRREAPEHDRYRAWLEDVLAGSEAYGVAELVLSGFVRVVTHARVFVRPSSLDEALAFADLIRDQPHAVPVRPGARHWGLFKELAAKAKARGKIIPDAYFAALAIESGCEWITTDNDFRRFPGLRSRAPFS